MSGVRFAVTTEGEVALAAATAKTVLQIVAGANHRVHLDLLKVTLKGIVPTDAPVLVEILRQTTAGTMTAITPKKVNDADNEALVVTGAKNATAEPTSGDVIDEFLIHPQGGYAEVKPFNKPVPIIGGGRIGIRITAPQANTARVSVEGEE
jgi:hypothetical protein